MPSLPCKVANELMSRYGYMKYVHGWQSSAKKCLPMLAKARNREQNASMQTEAKGDAPDWLHRTAEALKAESLDRRKRRPTQPLLSAASRSGGATPSRSLLYLQFRCRWQRHGRQRCRQRSLGRHLQGRSHACVGSVPVC